ncbi:hypothetical protein ZWY2020_018171 [Hordeum vulgare]|nr:hypothetical protein ZWY2020_018166 [Hordeum vulgare]KAI4985537.1 hypothetical protein ZWY2020_018167 [Hordeum vulgare]KAI4985538.1 hypothetical protein ZWY2020_018168 [Hordeum vulgare]KAI4985539.1 hypothetical protein ZWY2020_018169 [Hordeum vulgare]KAI4985541.1 hypothetical protein ZWY2020_018171 [Hordeum vulgare]
MEYSLKLAVLLLLALVSAMAVTAQNSPDDFVDAHNAARAEVGLGKVTWNATVAAYAQDYAEQRRGDCQLIHGVNRPYGENLYGGDGFGTTWTAANAVSSWVSEKQYYDHGSNSCSAPADKSCMHYTQVVWRNSTAIGCARVICASGNGVFIICSYSPPGNYPGVSPY